MPKKPDNIDAHVGTRIRLRRMLLGMSQEKLGENLGLTFQQVQKYEKGINRIGAGRLFQIAQILGVSIPYLYDGVQQQLSQNHAGFAEESSSPPVLDFLSSGEGMQLNLAFTRIKDPKVRKRVVELVKSLADDEEGKEA